MATKADIQTLYQQTLNRAPRDDEVNWWLMSANNEKWTPAQLRGAFLRDAIPELYTSTLGRSPNPDEVAYWQWAQGELASPAALRTEFMRSAQPEIAINAARQAGANRQMQGITATGLAGRTYTPFTGDYTRYGFGPESLLFTNTGKETPIQIVSGEKWRTYSGEPPAGGGNIDTITGEDTTAGDDADTDDTVDDNVTGGGAGGGAPVGGGGGLLDDTVVDDKKGSATIKPGGSQQENIVIEGQDTVDTDYTNNQNTEGLDALVDLIGSGNDSIGDYPEDDRAAYNQQVTSWYQGLLGRAPTQADLNYWGGELAKGIDAGAIQESIATSPEALLNREYRMSLGRTPTQADYNYWLGDVYGQGTSIGDIRQAIRSSPEAQLFSGYNTAAQNVQLQPYDFYLNQLTGGAPVQGLLSTINQPQFVNNGLLATS
jgi:hypothetical protein